MAPRTKVGGGEFGWEHVLVVILAGAAMKVASDEIAIIVEHGFDNWRRRRLGW